MHLYVINIVDIFEITNHYDSYIGKYHFIASFVCFSLFSN